MNDSQAKKNINLLEILRNGVDLKTIAGDIALDTNLSASSSYHAQNIYDFLNSPDGMRRMQELISGNITSDEVCVTSGTEVFYFSGTFLWSRLVYLRFLSKSGFEIFVVQFLNGLVGAFSFSDLSVFVFKKGERHRSWASSLIEIARGDSEGVKEYLENDKFFYGLLLNTETRPSHFFYEMLCPVANEVVYNSIYFSSRHIYWNKTDFIDVANIINAKCESHVVDWKEFSQKCIRNKWVVLQPGFGVWGAYNRSCDFVDGLLCKSAIKLPHESEKDRPVLWLSILSEEKSWVEQNDVYSEIIIDFFHMGYDPIVIFDGLTRTCSESYLPYSKKRKEVEYIQKKVGQYFELIDIHGFTAEEKISFAMLSDIFIASVGTDSMYPSRIAGKPGVVHSSPDVSMFGKHVYSKETVKTDPDFSDYLDDQEDLRPDKRSYSIKEGVVEDLFWACWEKVKAEKKVNDD